jgi:hypothetical protein
LFNINGEDWTILSVVPDSPYLKRRSGGYTVGVCDDNLKTIFVATGLDQTLLKKVLCHEIVHAAMFSYNVELTLEQEELVADLIASYGEEIFEITNQMFKKIKGAYF